jgi:hypothetical protein
VLLRETDNRVSVAVGERVLCMVDLGHFGGWAEPITPQAVRIRS